MDIKEELITKAVNSVGPGLSFGTANDDSLITNNNHVYRVTGMDQIVDIIECGYVRPKGFGNRSKRVGHKIYWSIGGEGVHYDDKRPVLEAPKDKVVDGQEGSIPITDLSAIWMYNGEENRYCNRLKDILCIYRDQQKEKKDLEKTNMF